MHQQKLLNTEEAADYLGVEKTFLERDRCVGARVPFVRLGSRTIRYRPCDLDDFIASRVCASTSDYSAASRATG